MGDRPNSRHLPLTPRKRSHLLSSLISAQEAAIRFSIIIVVTLVLSAVGLTYEIAAGRVLAPYFGTSLSTWTAVIATVLGGFSLGNAIGGVVAERPRATAFRNLRAALVATAILMSISPVLLVIMHELLAGGMTAMLITVVAVFFLPSVCVTLPSPLLTKLAIEARPGREGSSLGLVMAAGSIGAIFGSVLAGFVTLPLIGSVATFSACGAAALICYPFIRERDSNTDAGHLSGIVAPIIAAVLVGSTGMSGFSVCQFESELSCLRVSKSDTRISMFSDGVAQASESLLVSTESSGSPQLSLPYTQYIWGRMDEDLGSDPEVLFVGGGGYTLPAQLLRSRDNASAIVVEIDPLITKVAAKHLPRAAAMIAQEGYDAAGTPRGETGRLGIIHADGRVFLNETDMRFDAAVMDAFSSNSVPAHLVTIETFERIAEIVDGPVYVNLIDGVDGPLARGVLAILQEVYPYIEVVQGPIGSSARGNVLLAASAAPFVPSDDLPKGYVPADISPARPFTDDRGWTGHR